MSKQTEPQPVDVNGRPLRCVICSHHLFWITEAQLNKASSSLFNIDWADRSAACFICSECTYVHWFYGK